MGGDDSAMDSDLLMLMMMGGQGMGQMNPLMLSMLLDSEPDYDRTKLEKICDDAGAKAVKDAYDAIMKNKKSDMSDLLLLSMLGGQGMGDMNSMLPLLLMKDGSLGDNKTLMLMMMQGGMGGASMNPLLMMSLLE